MTTLFTLLFLLALVVVLVAISLPELARRELITARARIQA